MFIHLNNFINSKIQLKTFFFKRRHYQSTLPHIAEMLPDDNGSKYFYVHLVFCLRGKQINFG